MRKSFPLIIVALACVQSFGQDKPKAYLRQDGSKYVVDVYTFREYKSATSQPIVAALYGDNQKLSNVVLKGSGSPAEGRFKILVPQSEAEIAKTEKYVVAVQSYPDAAGDEGWSIPVGFDLAVEMSDVVLDPGCIAQSGLSYSYTITNESETKEGEERLAEIENFLEGKWGVDPKGLIEIKIDLRRTKLTNPLTRKVLQIGKSRIGGGGEPAKEHVCFKLDHRLPSEDFDISLKFAAPAPLELQQEMLLTDQSGVGKEAAIAKLEDSDVGGRQLERNLDMAGLLASSVQDEEQPNKTFVRKRKTAGTLDLRFAPLLNFHPNRNIAKTVRTPKYFTPFFIDAKVSTGKISKDTLSLNRIYLGAEGEIRNYPRSQPSNFYRYIIRGSSASDRDFKLAEFKAGFEFQPFFGRLNHPLAETFDWQKNLIDKNPNRGLKILQSVNSFGWQIQPIFGVEFGRRYRSHRPAEAVSEAFRDISPVVRRIYFGTNMEYNLTSRATLTIKDLFYVRGEAPQRRRRNYFIATLEAPLGNLGSATGIGLFFSFEHGQQPPFANPDVNVFKVGYRITSNGWLNRIR